MRWDRFYPGFRVPKGILDLVDAGFLVDTSHPRWKMPTFEVELVDGAVLVMEVRHPDPADRGYEPRYAFVEFEPGSDMAQYHGGTDNLREALWILKFLAESRGGPRRRFKIL